MEVESVSAEEQKRLTQKRFEAAVKVIKSLPPNGPFQPSNDMMLKFYSYYKQATIGPCNIPRPGFWDVVGKAKWDAWNSLGEMSEEEAMAAYVDQMKLILEGMPMTDEVEELLRILGPFYELIDEKKKITQISDLSTARLTKFARQLEGFGTVLNSMESKSVAKSIIRNMEMNGTLETRPARLRQNEEVEQEEEEEEDEDEEEEGKEDTMEIRKATQPKKKISTRRHKASLQNGKLSNGGSHLANGSHQRADNEHDASNREPLTNGHHTDTRTNQVTSDSDSEVYCDSVDQFGQEENSEQNRSLDDLEEEDSHFLEEDQDPPQAARRRREERETGGTASLRLDRWGREEDGHSGSRSLAPGSQLHRSGDGPEPEEPVPPRGSLDEQIVVALARVQEDIQSVLERMRTVEALTANLARSVTLPSYGSPPGNKRNRNPSWWPFDISPTSLAFAIIWPFVVQWLIRLYFQKRRRRIN
ncbi:PREDICTED: acyl-CoA-binding domain-containing protein 5 isoform X1 [Poecilia mexicana]|uniref:acyl-CoA-binding domain-containing protein 5 isoform X1 n=1 Tax=Poecilia mexicana TaxID=48701 RepID=UPI00072EECC9|nr:PREDICTED: acyl-CoA-binding domain-containing protein 5 isoform X1 [Poecilia mexicana]XP_014852862.1 PREDICTED: acyl-CoA-binding domain-containing protein 5 isoform X1 [Poecilia mexicana]XP_014852863.1 PREDICTED: acyl-CoA-binding domain-containing protein 5 isoform X1 [Poecilia mexicana]XP_014852864.1 PREDICTED: acyl-CoA-binding domain-containing protein 5 isoform X1 [Poecilia mexicana]